MKNPDTPQNQPQDKENSQKQNTEPKNNNPNTNPYDSENLDQESDSQSKDITEKDIEKDLIKNDPSKGFETDIDKPSGSDKSNTFETIQPDEDNPVNREFEIGELSSEDLQEDEQAGMKQRTARCTSISLRSENIDKPENAERLFANNNFLN